jgi:hypothetical protein
MQEREQNYHRRATEIQEEVADKPSYSSSFSSPSLSTLENSYPKLNYSLALSSLVCLTNELMTPI